MSHRISVVQTKSNSASILLIFFLISSIAGFPMLPICECLTVLSGQNLPFCTDSPTLRYASLNGIPERTSRLTSSTVNR